MIDRPERPWWQHPDDPEVRWECTTCLRPLPEDSALPICKRCEGAARVHGRAMADEERYREERELW